MAVFGVFWRRTSSKAAFATLWTGFVLGLIVFFLDFFRDSAWLTRFIEWKVPVMMATFYLFLICSAIIVIISLFEPHKHTAESEKLVWANPLDALRGQSWRGLGNYRVLAGILFVVMIALYIKFA